jgi:hypothetical protein
VTYVDLTDPELHKLTKRRLQDRPADALEWRANIDDLRELAVESHADRMRPRHWRDDAAGLIVRESSGCNTQPKVRTCV